MKFSEYFDTIKGMAAEGAQIAAKKTKQMASVTKATIAIRGEEDKIKKAQLEIGKLFYKDYIVGEEPDMAEYLPWCEKISESKIAIEDFKIAIEEMKANGEAVDDDFVVEVITEDDEVCGCGDPDCTCHDHHHEEETCGCGDPECTCGHDHDHEEEETCCCGHDHDHEEETCCCGHDHDHEEETCCCDHDHT